jgi:hypothetical protein
VVGEKARSTSHVQYLAAAVAELARHQSLVAPTRQT